MSSYSGYVGEEPPSGGLILLRLIVLVIIGIFLYGGFLYLNEQYVSNSVASTYPNDHAVEKHGEAALEVSICLNKNGPLETWFNSDTNRTANVVCLDDGKFGIEICDGEGNNITCFIKEKMKKLDQVK